MPGAAHIQLFYAIRDKPALQISTLAEIKRLLREAY